MRLAAATVAPEPHQVAPLEIGGFPHLLRQWTREQWSRIPADYRPPNAFQGSRGDWFAIVADL